MGLVLKCNSNLESFRSLCVENGQTYTWARNIGDTATVGYLALFRNDDKCQRTTGF